MKIFKIILCASVFFFVFFTVSSSAVSDDDFWNDFSDNASDMGVDFENEDELLSGIGIDTLLNEIVSAVRGSAGTAFSFLFLLLGISVFLSLSEALGMFRNNKTGVYTGVGISLIFSLVIFSRLAPLCSSVKASIEEASMFFSGMIPILTGVSAAGGNMNTAAAEALNMNITLAIVGKVVSSVLIPLVFTLFALSLLSGIDNGGISAIAKWIKSAFMWVLGIGTAVIIAAVSMQSIVAGARDGAYLRAAKYAASGLIPVVGGTVSGALGTLAGGLSYLKSTLGVASVFIISVSALSPLVMLLLHRAAISICISFLEFSGSSGGVRTFSAFKASLDVLIAVYSISMVIYISEIVIFIKSGVEVFG